jgi:hypothetical protein
VYYKKGGCRNWNLSQPYIDLICAADVAARLHLLLPHRKGCRGLNLRAKKPSSSSLRVGAGKGAPGAVVGSRIPPSPKGLSDCSLESIGVFAEVLTGRSASRRLHPREFMESLKEVDAMLRQARE